MKEEETTGKIIGCAMKVHRTLGNGFLESVYQNALVHELKLVVNGCIIVENKAVQKLCSAHEVQLVNYLTATGVDIGLLLNFGSSELEFKRKYRSYDKSAGFHPVNPVNPD